MNDVYDSSYVLRFTKIGYIAVHETTRYVTSLAGAPAPLAAAPAAQYLSAWHVS